MKIIQIQVVYEHGNRQVYGLGDDGVLYRYLGKYKKWFEDEG